jgi:hypothetical protein
MGSDRPQIAGNIWRNGRRQRPRLGAENRRCFWPLLDGRPCRLGSAVLRPVDRGFRLSTQMNRTGDTTIPRMNAQEDTHYKDRES